MRRIFCLLVGLLIWVSVEGESKFIESELTRGSFRSILTPKSDLSISTKAEGVIATYHKKEGDSLKVGDIILELDSAMERVELEMSRAKEEGAQSELFKMQSELKRVSALHKEKIHSDKQYEDATYQLSQAQSRYKQALKATQAAQIRLDNRSVRSPIDGVFFKKNKDVGEVLSRFEVAGRVIDASSLEATFYCGASYLGQFKQKDVLEVQLLDGPLNGEVIQGEAVYVDHFIDPASGTFRVKIKVQTSQNVSSGLAIVLLVDEKV